MTAVAPLIETPEQTQLRESVAALAASFGDDYVRTKVDAGEPLAELWNAAGELGLIGVALPEEFGGGGGGLAELAIVSEELAAAGAPLLMLVVSPAINGSTIARYGTAAQQQRWLPGIASGETIAAFAITEPDAGSNSHRIKTTARRDGDDWIITGNKVFISGVDIADVILVVTRTAETGPDGAATGRLRPALFLMPTDAPGLVATKIDMDISMPESQYQLFFDEVRLPNELLLGENPDGALAQLFAGLNPERILAAAMAVGTGRFALGRAVEYAKGRSVFRTPIGAHQAIAHPLARCKIELELAKAMTQKAAALYDLGNDLAAAEAANMAKYAAGEASAATVDHAIHTLGGNGLTAEYGLARMLTASRLPQIAPVSREMILNFVAEHSLGLPKSY